MADKNHKKNIKRINFLYNINMRIFRMAPSPTGNMHLGNARTAIVNYYASLQIKDRGEASDFFLRIDDKEEYEQNIYKDLEWLKITYSKVIKQSERTSIYEEYFQKLINEKRVYECFETEEELDTDTIYNRKALYLSADEKVQLRKIRPSYWRFFMLHNDYVIKDLVMGTIKTKRSWSDPIIKRPQTDKAFTYNFTSAIDDMLMGVTDVIRGQEHLNNAIIQQEIIDCFSHHKIQFAHLPVIITPDGQKLSKRLGDLSLQTLKKEGYHCSSVISMCLSLGTNKPPLITSDLKALTQYFDLKSFSRSSPKFEKKNIQLLNTKILKQLRPEDLKELGFDEEIWTIIKNNINNLEDYYKWQQILTYPYIYKDFPQKDLLKKIYKDSQWDFTSIKDMAVKKKFLISLHESLTGQSSGPELEKILNYKIKFPAIRDILLS